MRSTSYEGQIAGYRNTEEQCAKAGTGYTEFRIRLFVNVLIHARNIFLVNLTNYQLLKEGCKSTKSEFVNTGVQVIHNLHVDVCVSDLLLWCAKMSGLARDIAAAAMRGLWILQSLRPAAEYSTRKSNFTYIWLARGTNKWKSQSVRSGCLFLCFHHSDMLQT